MGRQPYSCTAGGKSCGCQGRDHSNNGLRVLARLIARELINKRRQIGVEAGSEGMSTHKVSEEKRENLPRN